MKIRTVKVDTIAVEDRDELAIEGARQPKTRHITLVRVETDCGLEGLGVGFAHFGLAPAMDATTRELGDLIIGSDPARTEEIAAKLAGHCHVQFAGGISRLAVSAIDLALWDIKGKAAGLPLWKLLGGFRNHVETYASGPVHRDIPDDVAIKSAINLKDKGFRQIKMHLSLGLGSTPKRELQRARLIRDAIGDDVRLVADINNRWRVGQARQICVLLQEIDFLWIEDPIRADDYVGMAQLRQHCSMPIMAGESNWGLAPFRLMLERGSVDILMIDVMLAGGITQWMKIAALAEAHEVPVVSHLLPEFQAQLVAAVPNGLVAEYKEWTRPMFAGQPELRDGVLWLSDRPGHGLELSDLARKSLRDQ